MIYKKYEGTNVSVIIENIDANDPYTEVGNKAFLSCKNVAEIKLPDTISVIGDWAFAHMKGLRRIEVPAKSIAIGKDAFLDCDSLKDIIVYPDASGNPGLSALLATCITVLKASELLDFKMSAENNDKWCELYDSVLLNYICQADEKDFQMVIVGWFNDEAEEEQLSRHIERTKTNKINLSFLRLKHDTHIKESTRESLVSYLKNQVGNSDSDNLSWHIIKDTISEDIQYAKVAVANSLLNESQTLELIKYLNDKNANPEIAAYLITSISGVEKNVEDQFAL